MTVRWALGMRLSKIINTHYLSLALYTASLFLSCSIGEGYGDMLSIKSLCYRNNQIPKWYRNTSRFKHTICFYPYYLTTVKHESIIIVLLREVEHVSTYEANIIN